MTWISATDVTVRLGAATALHRVTARFDPGVTALVGPNGAGKSTLMNVLSGFYAPLDGAVEVDGDRVALRPEVAARRGIARTFQRPRLAAHLTVLENMTLASIDCPEPWRRSLWRRALLSEEASGMLAACGILSIKNLQVSALSYGQRKLVGMACALTRRPRVLLLDEPVAALEPAARERTRALLTAEAKRGVTVIVAEHDVLFLREIADRAVMLLGGRVVDAGEAGNVLSTANLAAWLAAPL